MKKSLKILQECAEIQSKKSKDYQSDVSSVEQADYYVNGVSTIYDIMWAKMLRIKSIQETVQRDPDHEPNFEGLRDSVVDLINYASFYGAYLDNGIPGQDEDRDIFNRKKVAITDKQREELNEE